MKPLNLALETLDKIKNYSVLVIGDLMLDKFIRGAVGRISPEAPIPVLSVQDENIMLGGAGNVVSNLEGLGASVVLVSVSGTDETHDSVSQLLNQTQRITAHLIQDASRPTSIKTRYLAGHQQLLRADSESTAPIAQDIEDQVIAKIEDSIPNVQAVILSDYGKGLMTQRVIEESIRLAEAHNVPVLVDPKGSDYSRYRGASVVTPNLKELSEATSGLPVTSNEDMEKATQALLEQSGIKAVVATRSADGMSIRSSLSETTSNDNSGVVHLKTIAREVFDVSGAGDTVIATIAAGLATGADLVTAASLANAAGGLVVEKVGTAAIRHDELKGFLFEEGHLLFDNQDAQTSKTRHSGGQTGQTFAPVMSWQDAADQVARWKARGLKVGFTNGAFDIIHQGHVTLLDRTRAACDRLIIGLNCDASIKRYKSEDRPINLEFSRASVLAALQSVDMVVIFGERPEEEDTPLMLMQALRPDMIAKGADYTIDQVVGAEFVQSYGGEVALIPLEEGYSTTNTIKKMTDVA